VNGGILRNSVGAHAHFDFRQQPIRLTELGYTMVSLLDTEDEPIMGEILG